MRTARRRDPARTARSSVVGSVVRAVGSLLPYEPGVDPLLEPDGAPDPDGGVPDGAFEFEPLPMLGQFLVEPELEPELELESEPVDEFEEPEPVLPALELDGGVVEEELDVDGFDVELVPVFPEPPVVVDGVAASATSAPPATRPDVNAPMASTLRKRICMGVPFLVSWRRPTRTGGHTVRSGSECSRRGTWAGTRSYLTNG